MIEPSVIGSPFSTSCPSSTFNFSPNGIEYDLLSSLLVIVTCFFFFISVIDTTPEISVIIARPFGLRASNSSSTLGRPCVISAPPATPPEWIVLIVSCVPGSPIDWAAIVPIGSPICKSPLVDMLIP